MQLFPLLSCQLLTPEAVTAAGVGIRSGSSEPASWQGWNLPTFVQILWPCPEKVAYCRRADDLVKSLLPTIHSLHSQIGHSLPPPYCTYCPSPFLMPSDVDECVTGTHHCQQHCVNTRGSYKCACEGGYVLSSSGLFCIGQLEQHALTYLQQHSA